MSSFLGKKWPWYNSTDSYVEIQNFVARFDKIRDQGRRVVGSNHLYIYQASKSEYLHAAEKKSRFKGGGARDVSAGIHVECSSS